MNRERLLERFLRYVKVDTTSNEAATSYPSTPGQLTLGRILREELDAMGVTDADQDEYGLVYATIPSTIAGPAPVVALNSHLDTSPETSGANVNPQVIENYQGGDISLPGDPSKVIRVSESPELDKLHGCTIITTDGTTLLGSDDKAGVAVIMETAAYLLEHPDIPHGDVRVLFTCDEEVGRGVDHVDFDRLAADVGYTLDGRGTGEIDTETFSADLAIVTVRGVNIHPSIAKGQMVNAIRAAADFISRLPHDTMAPEVTSEREGFMHPYQMQGGVAEVRIRIILRDFQTDQLTDQANLLREIAKQVEAACPGTSVDVDVSRQYRNMADGLKGEPRVVEFAQRAHVNLGLDHELTIVRGGTDGSQLTERGLPTPNLSTGQHRIHSPLEWACLDEMVQAGNVLVELLKLWSQAGKRASP